LWPQSLRQEADASEPEELARSIRLEKLKFKTTSPGFHRRSAGGDKAKATETLRAAVKKVDQVAAKGSIHKNAASRKKSRLQKL
jgi:small subunit ribosomal protein S20